MHKIIFLVVLTLVLAGTVEATLVGWWKMDDGSGTVAADSSGQGNNGTVNGGATWVAGQLGGAVKFDGSDDYVSLPIASLMNPMTNCTITTWANWSGTGSAWQRLWDFGTGQTFNMFITPSNGSIWRFAITIAGYADEDQCSATTTLPTGWHNVAVTMDAASKTHVLWLDGELIAQKMNARNFPKDLVSTQHWIGRSEYSADPYFNGSIDDFRIYDVVLTQDNIKAVMGGAGATFEAATQPVPALNATDMTREPVLGWKAGPSAKTHDVYFGTSFADVNTATRANPLGALISKGQDATSLDLTGRLEFGTTYYWRVDEVDASGAPFKGDIWNFKTELFAYAIAAQNITATASSKKSAAEGPENTINGSGMTGDLASTDNKTMWASINKGTLPVWIQYDFNRAYKLYELWVWNYNSGFESMVGIGAKSTVVEYSTDGTTWTKLGDFEFADAAGVDDNPHDVTVSFGGVAVKSVKITINSAWISKAQAGLSEVRFLYIPVEAQEPKPATNSTGIDPTTVALSWRAGREAVSHNVYVSTDANALTLAGTASTNSFSPANLILGTKYYWRVDEVNAAASPTTWASEVWNFTAPGFLVVDDMESYNDKEGTSSFNTWADGYNTTTNGALVGYNQPANGTFNETVTIHSGSQSMPLTYGNTGIATSEATRTYATPQNWTLGGVKTLTLWFYGAVDNGPASLYVKINGTKIAYTGDAGNIQRRRWNQWNIDLSTVAAATLKSVTSLVIGVTNGASKGLLLIDDIRLYKSAPVITPTDPGTSSLVSYFNMEGGKVADSITGTTGTLNGTTFVDSAPGLGKALQCTGGTTAETTQYVDLGAAYWDKVVSKLSSCTFSAWVNYTGTGAIWQRVFDFGSGTNTNVFLCTSSATVGFPRFAVKTNVPNSGSAGTGYVEAGVTSSQRLWVGWHHMAAVVDATGGAAGNPVASLYVDGALVGGPSPCRLPKDMVLQTPTPWQMWLGKSQWADPYLNGAIDELKIFNRALTGGEVSYLTGDR